MTVTAWAPGPGWHQTSRSGRPSVPRVPGHARDSYPVAEDESWRITAEPVPTGERVILRLRYTNNGSTPWKWHGVCPCGWNLLSWDWARSVHHINDHLRERHRRVETQCG